jgi:hypothetical protein
VHCMCVFDGKMCFYSRVYSSTLPVFSGIFFLYIFLVKDPGKQVQCAGSAGGEKTNTWLHRVWLGAGVFGARRNALTGPFGRLGGTGKSSATPEPEGPTRSC